MNDNDHEEIAFDVVWNYLHRGRNWHACAGFILDVMGHLAIAADEVEVPAVAESIMRVVEDPDGSFLQNWKRMYRRDADMAVRVWRTSIEPGLIRLWQSRAATDDVIKGER